MRVASFKCVTDDGCTWLLFVDQDRWPEIPPQFLHVDWSPAGMDFKDMGKKNVTPMRVDVMELGYAVFRATAPQESYAQSGETPSEDLVAEST